MSFLKLKIKFKAKDYFFIRFGAFDIKKEAIPFWATFKYMPCPGNIKHGPDIDNCRLSMEIETLINYFSDIKSVEKGLLTVQINDRTRLQIDNDAQNIFFQSVWFILLRSQCSAFKFNQWVRGNYLPSTDPERMYYTLFSIFLTEHYFISPDELPDIGKFKSELLLFHMVLKNLLNRIRGGRKTTSDSVSNGLVLFDTLFINLLNIINIEGQHRGVAERMTDGSILAGWV